MRYAFFGLIVAFATASAAVKADPSLLQSLPGEWHQIASDAGACTDCRVVIGTSGDDFTVKSNNGWSAIVRQSFQEKPFVAGKGSWEPNIKGYYGGKPFFLNLGMKEDQLLMLMTVPDRDGRQSNIKAIFQRATSGGR